MIPIIKTTLDEKEAKAAYDAILSGWVTQGPRVKEFEESFAEYVGCEYACAISNCTAGLHLALLATGVKKGDVVLTVSHSFIATANSISYCQAHPVFVDIDLDTYNVSVESLEKILTEDCNQKDGDWYYRDKGRIAALLIVHQMGMPCDLNGVLNLSKKYSIPVIEDAACAIGSEFSIGGEDFERIGKPHGDIACFSFHPRKILTTGEGGMLTTNNVEIDQQLRLLRHQGMSVSDLKRHQSKDIIFEEYPLIGYNYRLTDIQAAIGLEQLKKIPEIISRRRKLADIYAEEFSQIPWIKTPIEPGYCKTNWQSYCVRLDKEAPCKRDELMQYLLDNGVSSRPGIMNAHQEKPYNSQGLSLSNSEIARETALILPLFPTMTGNDIKKIVDLIRNVQSG